MKIYDLTEGNNPLIISIPHAGTFVPDNIKERFTDTALNLPDTDWHVGKLYNDFAKENNATLLQANYSRYVIDLNRPPDNTALYPGQTKVSLCPDKTFDGQDIYKNALEPDTEEVTQRLKAYWHPYHDEIENQITRTIKKHGYAVLYDAHSIRSIVPRLFDGQLPDLNIGTADGKSCNQTIAKAAFDAAQKSSYSAVLNGRFIGGYITRRYGQPEEGVHALQMELTQSNYMNEDSFTYDETRAARLKPALEIILHAITNNAGTGIKPKPV